MKARHKFSAVATVHGGRRYASKLEARHAARLELLQMSGVVLHWHEQVPILLPGGITYRADFQVFWADGRCTYEECKGYETPEWKLKKRLFAEAYPHIDLVEVRK